MQEPISYDDASEARRIIGALLGAIEGEGLDASAMEVAGLVGACATLDCFVATHGVHNTTD